MHGLFAQHPCQIPFGQPSHAKPESLGVPSRALLGKTAKGRKRYPAGCIGVAEPDLPVLLKNQFFIHIDQVPLFLKKSSCPQVTSKPEICSQALSSECYLHVFFLQLPLSLSCMI
jgi:hypothetical protein